MIENKTVLIKFIGGPLDGDIKLLKQPYEPLLLIRSKFRNDIIHIYEFDKDPVNHTEPYAFKFKGYKKDKS